MKDISKYFVPVGRLFFSTIFVLSSLGHFQSGTVGYAAGHGVPFPALLVPFSGLMILVGGISVLLGYKARLGALLIILFLVTVTPVMHDFWALSGMDAMIQRIMFEKNLSMLGGALIIFHFGAGPFSIDEGAGR